jgi:hypothetical protein
MTDDASERDADYLARGIMSERRLKVKAQRSTPELVASIVVYLASDAAADVTGCVFRADGGKVGMYSHPVDTCTIFGDERTGPWPHDELVHRLPEACFEATPKHRTVFDNELPGCVKAKEQSPGVRESGEPIPAELSLGNSPLGASTSGVRRLTPVGVDGMLAGWTTSVVAQPGANFAPERLIKHCWASVGRVQGPQIGRDRGPSPEESQWKILKRGSPAGLTHLSPRRQRHEPARVHRHSHCHR